MSRRKSKCYRYVYIIQKLSGDHFRHRCIVSAAAAAGIIPQINRHLCPFAEHDPGCVIQNPCVFQYCKISMNMLYILAHILEEKNIWLTGLCAVISRINDRQKCRQIASNKDSLCFTRPVVGAVFAFICWNLST